ncbi:MULTISPECIES: ABC transporter permease [unclassified Aureispira]|uniref:cell division protein FtsX n=1 Tax=unclassified Aureispira TaxID=2649989 RepID=UPI0006980A34|nr:MULTISPECIES: permease-like cell division protein FtsX [unclassified Aureispira]WMX17306.1 permease-like cell division protein FtsX [Aureispira sp. CCB-E]
MPKTRIPIAGAQKTFVNYIATIISLIIMLYLLGVWGLLAIYTNQFLNYSKENIPFYIELKDEASEAQVFAFQKELEASTFVKEKTVEYISKEQALELFQDDDKMTKEDVLLFGENLLPNMIRFYLNDGHFEDYGEIVKNIQDNDFVEHVFYTKAPAESLSGKVYRLEIILLVLMLFFIFVVVTLIKNTLKLTFLANKDLIKTMQMVGATFEKMAGPYMRQSLKNGILSGIIAVAFLWLTRIMLENGLGTFEQYDLDFWTTILSIIIILVGVLLSWICTRHSVHKYLKTPVEAWNI